MTAYNINGMYGIDLESEVEAWLSDLPYGHYQRVMRRLAIQPSTPSMPRPDET